MDGVAAHIPSLFFRFLGIPFRTIGLQRTSPLKKVGVRNTRFFTSDDWILGRVFSKFHSSKLDSTLERELTLSSFDPIGGFIEP